MLTRSSPPARPLVPLLPGDVQAFDKLKEAVSMQIFKINANVKGIQTLLAKLDADRGAARGPRDTLCVRSPLNFCAGLRLGPRTFVLLGEVP